MKIAKLKLYPLPKRMTGRSCGYCKLCTFLLFMHKPQCGYVMSDKHARDKSEKNELPLTIQCESQLYFKTCFLNQYCSEEVRFTITK